MPAYVLVQVQISDLERYEAYKLMTPASIAAFGGRFLVRGSAVESLEGTWQPERLVILEFPDKGQAKAWWASELYAPAKALRQQTATTQMILLEGYTPG